MGARASVREGQSKLHVASSHRKNSDGGRRESSVRYIGRRAETLASIGANRFPDIDGRVQSVFGYDVRKYFDLKQANIEWNYMTDDSKIIELIKILYPIAKPIIDDLPHAYYFNDDTTPGEFLDCLIATIDEAMPEDMNWVIKYEGDRDDYQIHVLVQTFYPDELMSGHGIEIDWFLKLPNKLQELAYDVLGLLQKFSGLLLFYGCDESMYMLEDNIPYFEESMKEEDADVEYYQDMIKQYKYYIDLYENENGPVKTMERRIDNPTRSAKRLDEDLKTYNCRSEKSRAFIKWLQQGMSLLDDSIQRYTCPYDISQDEDYYASMDETCVVHYSIDESDVVFNHINEMFSDRANNIGITNFSLVHDLTETPIDELDNHLPDYPVRYTGWLDAMWDVQKLYTQ